MSHKEKIPENHWDRWVCENESKIKINEIYTYTCQMVSFFEITNQSTISSSFSESFGSDS